MNKCNQCDNNYLYRIYNNYIETFNGDVKKAGNAFNKLCIKFGDPRPIIELLNDITNGNCESCMKYKSLYENISK